jgi:hypothetical protein
VYPGHNARLTSIFLDQSFPVKQIDPDTSIKDLSNDSPLGNVVLGRGLLGPGPQLHEAIKALVLHDLEVSIVLVCYADMVQFPEAMIEGQVLEVTPSLPQP